MPLRDLIVLDRSGVLFIKGEPVDPELRRKLQDSAIVALDNAAEILVEDQALHEALKLGIISSTRNEELFFAKAVIWWGQKRRQFLELLANKQDLEM